MSKMNGNGIESLESPSKRAKKSVEEESNVREQRVSKISSAVKTILEQLGENPNREGLIKTPKRYAEALLFFSEGYEKSVKEIVNGAIFKEDHDEMVVLKNVPFYSLCEHHLVPFWGKLNIGYLPGKSGKVIGLSKLARLADLFARRLQIQERLTREIAETVMNVLEASGVGVVIDATHMCMVMRGVQKMESSTVTSCMLGVFRNDPKTREEFLSLIK